ncbi:MAG: shikimate dehydrogenase [Bacteroidales bacterium]
MDTFGLIGHPLSHSFSKSFFTEKFRDERIDAVYLNFDLEDISEFPNLLRSHPDLKGMNVTIPYKEAIIPYLDELDDTAKAIGAVNVIRVVREGEKVILKGYNSDVIGFSESIRPLLTSYHKKALVLGTGGASKAVLYALRNLHVEPHSVSRRGSEGVYAYEEITPEKLNEYQVVVNTTPLGMYPHVNEKPSLPYEKARVNDIFFDLIYNPEVTRFMAEAAQRGARTKNGYEMLIGQALEAWRIWNL